MLSVIVFLLGFSVFLFCGYQVLANDGHVPTIRWRRTPDPIDPIVEMRESRKRYVAMEHEAMQVWEDAFDPERKTREREEMFARELRGRARVGPPVLYNPIDMRVDMRNAMMKKPYTPRSNEVLPGSPYCLRARAADYRCRQHPLRRTPQEVEAVVRFIR